MTGEVTLQGRVLPIGGLKQKVLAAHAAGLTDVILPERNRGDLDDVPEDVREQMTFHPVMTIDEVLDARARAGARAVACAVVAASRVPEEVRRAADLLERRWTVSIIWASHAGARALQRVRAGARRRSRRATLADAARASSRRRASSSGASIDARPPRVEYRLTERGQRLDTLIAALERWAAAGS